MQLNEIHFAGFVGRDAEDRTTKTGKRVVTFSICQTEKRKDTKTEITTWLNVTAFGWLCDLAVGVKKGDNVYVRGKLSVATYKAKDGTEKTATSVIAQNIARIERGAPKAAGQGLEFIQDEEDIPF